MTTATTAPATKQVAINDIGSAEDFLAAVEKTLKFFNDGDLIEGTVVKIDRDEVLLDVGYKTEGVIPSRELSIKHDVDPNEVVKVGDHVEALVLQKEDKEGRLILSKKRAQYERAWGDVEMIKENDGVGERLAAEVVEHDQLVLAVLVRGLGLDRLLGGGGGFGFALGGFGGGLGGRLSLLGDGGGRGRLRHVLIGQLDSSVVEPLVTSGV